MFIRLSYQYKGYELWHTHTNSNKPNKDISFVAINPDKIVRDRLKLAKVQNLDVNDIHCHLSFSTPLLSLNGFEICKN